MSAALDLQEQYVARRAESLKLHEAFTNAQEVSATLAKQVQQGNAPWQIEQAPGQQYLPWNPSTGRDFSAGNAVSLMSQAQEAGYSDTRWLTSRQAEREGGQVRSGEQGTRIEFWQYGGIENGQAVQYEQPRVFSTTVFNAEQIDGLEAAPNRSTASRAAPQEVAPDQDTYPFGSEGHAKRALRKEIEAMIIGSQDGTGFQPKRSEAQADQWVKALQNDPREIYRAAADASRTIEQRRDLELDAFLDANTSLRRKASSLTEAVEALEAEISPRQSVPVTFAHETTEAKAVQRPTVKEWIIGTLEVGGERLQALATTLKAAQGISDPSRPALWERLIDGADENRDRFAELVVNARENLGSRVESAWERVAQAWDSFAQEIGGQTSPRSPEQPTLSERIEDLADRFGRTVGIVRDRPDLEREMPAAEPSKLVVRGDEALSHAQEAVRTYRDALAKEGAAPFESKTTTLERNGAHKAVVAALNNPEVGPRLRAGADRGLGLTEDVVLNNFDRLLEKLDPRQLLQQMSGPVPIEQDQSNSVAASSVAPAAEPTPPTFIRSEHPAMSPSDDQLVYLAVPFAEKDDAKQAGAKWDKAEKAWFVPAGVALDGFTAWMPLKDSVHIAAGPDPREAFGDALRQAGLQVQGTPEMDGQMHRVQVEGDRGKEKSGAYAGYLDGHPAGFFQNFRTGEKSTWKAVGPPAALSAQDRAQLAGEAAQKRQDRAHDRERMYERTAQQVNAIWAAATPATAHPYLETKTVQAHATRQAAPGTTITVEGKDGQPKQLDVGGQLLVPVRGVEGNLQSLQIIRDDGSKMFMPGGRVDGGHMVIGDLDQPGPLLLAEGFATAATLHQLSGQPVVVAFNAGNLGRVAEVMRQEYPDRAIYLAGDNDHLKEAAGKPNVGREKAEAAANAIGGYVLLPSFTPSSRGTDWNDLAKSEGRDIAQFALQAGFRGAERDRLAAAITATRSVDRSASLAPNLTSSEQVGNEPAGIER